MTREELLARLNSIEWDDVEFKEAAWAVPRDALSTVSAFANTTGGYLVFGVKQTNGSFEISGVINADKVQNDFLGHVRDANKISVFLPIEGKLHTFEKDTVIVFYVPEAKRNEKPVFLDRSPYKAYIRRAGRDDTCTRDELIRFVRDASDARYDNEPLPDFSVERCFDETTVRWYRQRHAERNPGRYEQLSDAEFLQQMACIVEKQQQLVPTRAGILIFGTDAAVRQILTRPVVDFQIYREPKAAYSAEARWFDRLTPVPEENLLKTWQLILSFYSRHAEHPFSIDPGSLRRSDDPPDYVSFREAAINLLIHQDFGEQTRWPTIHFFGDQTEYFNPGDAFTSREQLLDPGEKPVRNPSVVAAFRRIGLSDQAGSGVGAIFDSWRRLGYMPPEIENDKAEKSFRLRLRRERLLSEEQLLAQASLGVQLTEAEASVFAFLIRKGEADLADIKALTGLTGSTALELAKRLAVQVIVRQSGGPGTKFVLAEHLQERYLHDRQDDPMQNQSLKGSSGPTRPTEQVTEQVGIVPTDQVGLLHELSKAQWAIVEHADAPRSLAELMRIAGYTQRPHFKSTHLEPLIAGGVMRMTVPDKPTSSKQRYVLTPSGLKLKSLRLVLDAQESKKEDAE